ncbi:MAG TPA: hypothetical protein VKR43_06705 [Bryobacteraceae bacterium]|jgi:hypothetical protein|nr:hypothetical protein [Bryobacteraceae bacterium]
MPSYRVHRLKDHLRQPFRFAPHVAGAASVKPRDYEPGSTVEAPSPYAAYFSLRDSAAPLEVGDLLESENSALWICKFIGFDEAQWVLPEVRGELRHESAQPVATGLE